MTTEAPTKPGTIIPQLAHQYFQTVSNTSLPALDRLLAIQELRVVMRGFEQTLVADARTDGRTWEDIGGTLEITRQAAQQRFADG